MPKIKYIDIKGQRFGKLLVKEYISDNRWLCQCDCGKERTFTGSQLISGHNKSCGCILDLTGQRFGKLKVIKKAESGKWFCECDCGQTTFVSRSNLTNGHTKSCGCLKGHGIIGRKIDQLTVMQKLDNDIYLCECDCGNTREVSYKFLMSGAYMSCRECATKRHNDAIVSATFKDGTQPGKIKLNKPPNKSNKSGATGVNWDKARGKWQASIRFKGRKYNLGRFDDKQDAINARKKAEQDIYLPYIEEQKEQG